jgi:hypothetical protein
MVNPNIGLWSTPIYIFVYIYFFGQPYTCDAVQVRQVDMHIC